MSLITCCPACGTMFKVVPDQLKVSEGWVRCGHCSEVFDASAHLQAVAAEPEPAVPAAAAQGASAIPAATLLREPSQEATPPGSQTTAARAPAAAPESESPYESEPLVPSPLDQPFVVFPQQAYPPMPPALSLRSSEFNSEMTDSEVLDTGPPLQSRYDSELDDVSFVKQARRKAFWRRPMVRALLALLLLVLGAVLVLQFAVQERDRIAAVQPPLRPALEALCAPLGCAVAQAPRQIEAIVVEGSTFSKLRGDTYRLSLTIKNTLPLAVAMPSVELTLTDGQDQPVMRRVLQPQELGGNNGTLAAAADWSGAVALAVAPGASGNGRIAGYRVLAFYP
jgi:predicted Zn finger-like uncharacterized protein